MRERKKKVMTLHFLGTNSLGERRAKLGNGVQNSKRKKANLLAFFSLVIPLFCVTCVAGAIVGRVVLENARGARGPHDCKGRLLSLFPLVRVSHASRVFQHRAPYITVARAMQAIFCAPCPAFTTSGIGSTFTAVKRKNLHHILLPVP